MPKNKGGLFDTLYIQHQPMTSNFFAFTHFYTRKWTSRPFQSTVRCRQPRNQRDDNTSVKAEYTHT